jgi:hypothetical protein
VFQDVLSVRAALATGCDVANCPERERHTSFPPTFRVLRRGAERSDTIERIRKLVILNELARASCLVRKFDEVQIASGAKRLLDLGVGEPFDEVRLDESCVAVEPPSRSNLKIRGLMGKLANGPMKAPAVGAAA